MGSGPLFPEGPRPNARKVDLTPITAHQGGAGAGPFWGARPVYTGRMADNRLLEDLAARLARVLPPGLSSLRAELEDNFRQILRANLERFDLVSRERFDAQAELLARTQAQLEALEKRLEALEKKR